MHINLLVNFLLILLIRYSVRDNVILDEVDKAEQEVKLYKASGGGTICEMSVVGMRRKEHSLDDLVRISKATGVHIVSTTGFYCESFLTAEQKTLSARSMADFMEEEILRGTGTHKTKCGVMYIACSDPLKESERRALEAAAITHRETGDTR